MLQQRVMVTVQRVLATLWAAIAFMSAALSQATPAPANIDQLVIELGQSSEMWRDAHLARDHARTIDISARRAWLLCTIGGSASIECAEGNVQLGHAHLAAGQYAAAIAALGNARALFGNAAGVETSRRSNELGDQIALVEAIRVPIQPGNSAATAAMAENLRALSQSINAWEERPLRLDLFLRALEMQLAAKGPDDINSIDMMAGASTLLFLENRKADARKMLNDAVDASSKVHGPDGPRTGNLFMTLGQSQVHDNQFPQAIDSFRRAIAIFDARGVHFPDDREQALRGLTWALEATGRTDEAEPMLRRLAELSSTGADKGYAQLALAENLLERGFVREAAELLDGLSAEHFDPFNMDFPMLGTLVERQRGRAAYQAGNWDQTAWLMQRTIDATTAQMPDAYRADDLALLATAKARLNRRDEARQLFEAALTLIDSQKLDDTHEAIRSRLAAAQFWLTEPGGNGRARDMLTKAYAAVEKLRLYTPPAVGAQRVLLLREAEYRPLFFAMADAWQAGEATANPPTAGAAIVFDALQRATLGLATEAVSQSAARRAAENNNHRLGEVAGELQRVEDRLLVIQRVLDASLTDPSRAAARGALLEEVGGLRLYRDDLIGQLNSDFPAYFDLVRPGAVELGRFQSILGPDEAAMLLVPAPDGVHVIAVTRDAVVRHKAVVPQTDLDTDVRRLLWFAGASVDGTAIEELTWQDEVPGTNAFDRKTAHRLYQQLIAPVLPTLAGKTHLFVTGGGALSRLPFSILVSAPPEGADDDAAALRDTRWLADDFALIHLPSLQSLYLQRAAAQIQADRPLPFVGVGDPALDGPPTPRAQRGAPAVAISALRQLAQLPGTATELRAVSARYGDEAKLMLRDDATEPAVMAAPLGRFRILAFATHALMAGEVGGAREAGLVLSPPAESTADNDGYLAMSEIAALRLNADWVILSACNSAGSDGSVGATGLSGLARAFLYAGAQNLLASHWPVLDAAAPPLIIDTLDPAQDGDRAVALQLAMRTMRHRPGFEESGNSYSHPRVWAPFVLIGDWR